MMSTTNALTIHVIKLLYHHHLFAQTRLPAVSGHRISRIINYDMIVICDDLESAWRKYSWLTTRDCDILSRQDRCRTRDTVDRLNWGRPRWLGPSDEGKMLRMLLRLCAARTVRSLREADWLGQVTVDGEGRWIYGCLWWLVELGCSLLIHSKPGCKLSQRDDGSKVGDGDCPRHYHSHPVSQDIFYHWWCCAHLLFVRWNELCCRVVLQFQPSSGDRWPWFLYLLFCVLFFFLSRPSLPPKNKKLKVTNPPPKS